jgi:hypothetical protein
MSQKLDQLGGGFVGGRAGWLLSYGQMQTEKRRVA